MSTPSPNNMYRVGDYVYFEVHAGYPYQIRRIEELNRANNGSLVEVKVQCYYRRRDIPNALIHLADPSFNDKHPNKTVLDNLTVEDKHSLFHRELFLSRQIEKVPAQYIRGKCSVSLISEVESPHMYISREDAFFYSLVYDPVNKTLLKDQGEMRVGFRYQAQVPPSMDKVEGEQEEEAKCYETLVWDPCNRVSEENFSKFMIIVRSIGTFSRALHHSSQVRETSLVNSAANASRDVALAYGHDLLNKCNYDIGEACQQLVPETGPLLIQDQSEEWSASEATLFEEALDKYGKDFGEIRKQLLPWKTMPAIIEYYYMWKTTDRYMRQKRIKATEAESKLKQVYIPSNGTYNNPNKIPVNGTVAFQCEGCSCKQSSAWFLWGPNNVCKLCECCWIYWKKFGGLKKPTAYEKSASNPIERDFKYECKQCKKQFSRQERLVNHMAEHTEFRCVVEGCDREFKVKNQLYRHLTAVHNLCITSKSSYAQVVKAREPFVMMIKAVTRQVRAQIPKQLKKMARVPCNEIDLEGMQQLSKGVKGEECSGENWRKNKKKGSGKGKRRSSGGGIDAIVSRIAEFCREASNSRKRVLMDRGGSSNGYGFPYKRVHVNGGGMSPRSSMKSICWVEATDAYLFVANAHTHLHREKNRSSAVGELKRASRRANFAITRSTVLVPDETK